MPKHFIVWIFIAVYVIGSQRNELSAEITVLEHRVEASYADREGRDYYFLEEDAEIVADNLNTVFEILECRAVNITGETIQIDRAWGTKIEGTAICPDNYVINISIDHGKWIWNGVMTEIEVYLRALLVQRYVFEVDELL